MSSVSSSVVWRGVSRQVSVIKKHCTNNNVNNVAKVYLSTKSSDKNGDESGFRPRRRSNYRVDEKKQKQRGMERHASRKFKAMEWEKDPKEMIDFLEGTSKNLDEQNAEDHLRLADFWTSARGSTEDLVGRRRALMDEEDPESIIRELERMQDEEQTRDFRLGEDDLGDNQETNNDMNGRMMDDGSDPNQLAHGPWSETVVRVDRVQKVQRGGTMLRYRSLVVGGNANGVAGFGVAKSNSPQDATAAAVRMCKRNIFFLDRYKGQGLTTSLVGKHNSCQVILRKVTHNYGLHGHPLVQEICKYFGLSDCSSKSHGNRNVYNVVRGTFKAILTHESLEEIALKRGKRLMHLDRAQRMQI